MTVIRMSVATVTASLAAEISLCAVIVYNHRLGRRKWRYNRSIKPAPEVQGAGYSLIRIHLTYVALHEVTWCMVVWCTQNLHRDGCSFMWHQPCQHCKYTTSVDIQKRAIKLVTHVERHASAVSLIKKAENSAM